MEEDFSVWKGTRTRSRDGVRRRRSSASITARCCQCARGLERRWPSRGTASEPGPTARSGTRQIDHGWVPHRLVHRGLSAIHGMQNDWTRLRIATGSWRESREASSNGWKLGPETRHEKDTRKSGKISVAVSVETSGGKNEYMGEYWANSILITLESKLHLV